MSKAKHEDAFLKGFGFPVFPEIVERIRATSIKYGIRNFAFLESSAKLVNGFLKADRPITSDGYHWFCGIYFIQGSGKIAVLIPWNTDYKAEGDDKSDRLIAIYSEGEVDIEKLSLQLIAAMIKFGTEENEKWVKYHQETMQRHHDFFVFRHRETDGVLPEVERKNYELAMAREANNLVAPLPADAVNYFKTEVEQEKPKESKG